MKKLTVVFTVMALSAALFLVDESQASSVNQRQRNQKNRIEQGVHSGSLTRQETKSLVKQEKKLNHKEHTYRSDGVLTKKEIVDLQTDQNQLSRRIYRQKHDNQTRETN